MHQRTYLLFLLLIIVCLSIPSGAAAQYTLTKISGDGQTGYPGQTLEPFVVQVLQNGNPVGAGIFVTFLHDRGSLSGVPVLTDEHGRAQSTLTLGSGAGTTTVTVSVQGDEVVFEARAISPSSLPEPTTPSTVPPPPKTLLGISGDGQTGQPGQTLEPFVIQVRTQEGTPSEGVSVIFFVLTGGGSLSATVAITNSNGRAASTLTLGSEPGTNRVQVSFPGTNPTTIAITGSEPRVIFSAEAIPAPPPPVPITIEAISGDNQHGLTGEALLNPFVVEVRDQYDNPLGGVTVTFAVTAGGGALSSEAGVTDINGHAESTLTLGGEPGTNTVKVIAEDISQTVIFSAGASLPPPMPTTLSIVSGENQEGLTGEPLADPLVVEVHDQYGNPMEGVSVTFVLLTDGGSLSAATVTTDSNGRAESTLTLGDEPDTNTVEVSIEGIAETVTFNAVAELLEFDLSLSSGLNLIHVPLKVRAVDGMTGTIDSVSDLYDALGSADTVHWLATYDSVTEEWFGYFGELDSGTPADSALTDQTGILANMKISISVRLAGDALGTDGMGALTLNQGLNLVGLPLNDAGITRVSDLFALEGNARNVDIIIVTANGEFKAVGRVDDPGDIEITGGQGFIVIVQQPATVPIIGTGWQ